MMPTSERPLGPSGDGGGHLSREHFSVDSRPRHADHQRQLSEAGQRAGANRRPPSCSAVLRDQQPRYRRRLDIFDGAISGSTRRPRRSRWNTLNQTLASLGTSSPRPTSAKELRDGLAPRQPSPGSSPCRRARCSCPGPAALMRRTTGQARLQRDARAIGTPISASSRQAPSAATPGHRRQPPSARV